ncbi:MAG: magnesium transporter, partial [Deinococcota bacterium]
ELIAPELVEVLLTLGSMDRVLLFRALPKDLAADVFSFLEADDRDELLAALTDQEVTHLLAELEPDERTELLGELPGQVTQRLLNFLSPDDLKEARQLLGYPEESVGRLMTPDYVAVRPEWTVARTLTHIRTKAKDNYTSDMIYVHDKRWQLIDALPLKRFIIASPEQTVEDLLDYSFVAISAYEDREEAVKLIQRYDRLALPVVDSAGILIGVVTVDDVFDVAEEEVTEDFQLSAAVVPFQTGYWQTSIWRLYRSRVGWLAALVLVSLVSSGVMAAFEDILEQAVALSFFIPLLIGAAGNTGSQSATLMIRAIGTGDVALGQWWRALARELVVGLSLGTSLGLLAFTLGIAREGVAIGLIVALSMLAMLFITNLLGMSLPFLLIRFNLDPASASGPLVASIADAIGLLVYFSIAGQVLQMFQAGTLP